MIYRAFTLLPLIILTSIASAHTVDPNAKDKTLNWKPVSGCLRVVLSDEHGARRALPRFCRGESSAVVKMREGWQFASVQQCKSRRGPCKPCTKLNLEGAQ